MESLLVRVLSFQGHEVYEMLCSKLSPVDLLNLSNTCRSLQWIKAKRWNINAHLSRFVRDPLKFRSLMARYNAIVSGSHALQFFEGTYWPESDLDLYMPPSEEDVVGFMKYLSDEEGYELKPYKWQTGEDTEAIVRNAEVKGRSGSLNRKLAWFVFADDIEDDDGPRPKPEDKAEAEDQYPLRNISAVFSTKRKDGRTIQIIVGDQHPVMSLIDGFYSTLVLNFYTWEKAYSLFPYLTFVGRIGAVLRKPDDKMGKCLLKYRRRGYRYTNALDPEDESPLNGLKDHRRIGDYYTWKMKLDTTGVDVSGFKPVPASVLEYSTFSVFWNEPLWRPSDSEREISHWELACKLFVNPILEHTYLYDSYDSKSPKGAPRSDRWVVEFGARVMKYALLECWMFEDDEVKAIAKRGYIDHSYLFPDEKPDTFRYRDGEVKAWYELWTKGKGIMASKKKDRRQ